MEYDAHDYSYSSVYSAETKNCCLIVTKISFLYLMRQQVLFHGVECCTTMFIL